MLFSWHVSDVAFKTWPRLEAGPSKQTNKTKQNKTKDLRLGPGPFNVLQHLWSVVFHCKQHGGRIDKMCIEHKWGKYKFKPCSGFLFLINLFDISVDWTFALIHRENKRKIDRSKEERRTLKEHERTRWSQAKVDSLKTTDLILTLNPSLQFHFTMDYI